MATLEKYTIELDNNAEDEFEFEWAEEQLAELFDKSDVGTYHLSSERMNWDGVSGFTVVDYKQVVNALKLNGDYRIEFHVDEATPDNYVVLRYSHDEPCGARFIVRPATDEEVEQYL